MNVKEIYPGRYKERFDGVYDYQPLLDSFGEILLQVDDEDYQGDSRLLLQKDAKIGLLIFGWGSCSGCDSLQACESYQDLQELADELEQKIVWKDTKQEMFTYIKEKDWELEYSWHQEETKRFVEESLRLLSDSPAPSAEKGEKE